MNLEQIIQSKIVHFVYIIVSYFCPIFTILTATNHPSADCCDVWSFLRRQSSSAPFQTLKLHKGWWSDPDDWTRKLSRPPSTAPQTEGGWSRIRAPSTSACRPATRPRTLPGVPSAPPPVSSTPLPGRDPPERNPTSKNRAPSLPGEDTEPRSKL